MLVCKRETDGPRRGDAWVLIGVLESRERRAVVRDSRALMRVLARVELAATVEAAQAVREAALLAAA